jgi:LacI family transcriptional regulator
MATLNDIARRAGVNISTVSRALNGSPEVSEETRRAILAIAEELGYRPNLAAQTLAGKSSRLVGVLLSDIRSGYFSSMMMNLGEFLSRLDYTPLLAMTEFDLGKEIDALEQFCNRQVAGIFVALPLNKKIREHLDVVRARFGIPIVLLETQQHWDEYDDVMIDDCHGMGLALDHLMAKGHRKIGFLTDQTNYPIRFPMFQEACAQRGIEVRKDFVCLSPNRFELGGFEAMNSLLAAAERPTAVLTGYDSIAIGAMRALYRAKLRIPDDMAVIGNDDIPEASYLFQPLTTIAPPVRELTSMGTHLLVEKIADPHNVAVHHVDLKPALVIRETT